MPLRTILVALIAATLLCGASSASAVTLGFGCITNNNATDCAIGEAQLAVTVSDPGLNGVLFTFTNTGLDAAAITDVYFDDGSLLGISLILDNAPNVEFSAPAIPSELPGANLALPPFETTAGFSADSDPAPPNNGVDPGESLGIQFDLINGGTVADVLDELMSGALRIGVHVQDYTGGGSESFVNLPEPSTGLLIALGLIGAMAKPRRSRD